MKIVKLLILLAFVKTEAELKQEVKVEKLFENYESILYRV
jgi:hypothetical protein